MDFSRELEDGPVSPISDRYFARESGDQSHSSLALLNSFLNSIIAAVSRTIHHDKHTRPQYSHLD